MAQNHTANPKSWYSVDNRTMQEQPLLEIWGRVEGGGYKRGFISVTNFFLLFHQLIFWGQISWEYVHAIFICPFSPSFYRYTVMLPVWSPRNTSSANTSQCVTLGKSPCKMLLCKMGGVVVLMSWRAVVRSTALEVDQDHISSSIIHCWGP